MPSLILSEADEDKLYQFLKLSADAIGEDKEDRSDAADVHLAAWRFACGLMDYHRVPVEPMLRSVGLQEPGEWALNVVLDLEEAGKTSERLYLELLDFCADYAARSDGADPVLLYLLRMTRAHSQGQRGQTLAADVEFDALTRATPQVPDGWLFWARLYESAEETAPKAIAILERARKVADMQDRDQILEQLLDLYELQEEYEKAEEVASELDEWVARKTHENLHGHEGHEHGHHHGHHHHDHGEHCDCGHDHGHGEHCDCGHDHGHDHVHGEHCDCDHDHDHEPAATVGRNDPCPCGSGKKYKKCCGA